MARAALVPDAVSLTGRPTTDTLTEYLTYGDTGLVVRLLAEHASDPEAVYCPDGDRPRAKAKARRKIEVRREGRPSLRIALDVWHAVIDLVADTYDAHFPKAGTVARDPAAVLARMATAAVVVRAAPTSGYEADPARFLTARPEDTAAALAALAVPGTFTAKRL